MQLPPTLKNLFDKKDFKFYKVIEDEDIYWFGKVPSTMDIASELINIKKEGIIVADEQTSGRGRYGKVWISLPGGLYFSWIMKPEKKISYFISQLISLSLIETMSNFKIICSIKLPNDIIYNKKKLSGILIEKKDIFYNVGIGINLDNQITDPEKETSISLILKNGDSISKEEVLREFILRVKENQKKILEDADFSLKKWSSYLIK